MSRARNWLIGPVVVAAALAASVTTAGANRLSISSQMTKIVWTSLSFNGGGTTVSCPVTIEGSFHGPTISKVAGSLIGFITRAKVGRPCTGGTGWVYNGSESNEVLGGTLASSLPWHISYEAFSGTLPSIAEIHILLRSWRWLLRVTVLGITELCNYTATLEHPIWIWIRIGRGGLEESAKLAEEKTIPSESGGACPTDDLSGTGTDTNGTGGTITLTLI